MSRKLCTSEVSNLPPNEIAYSAILLLIPVPPSPQYCTVHFNAFILCNKYYHQKECYCQGGIFADSCSMQYFH